MGECAFGHPVVIGRGLCTDELQQMSADAGWKTLRGLLADPLLSLEVTDSAVLDDLDTPSDLEALRARFEAETQRLGRPRTTGKNFP